MTEEIDSYLRMKFLREKRSVMFAVCIFQVGLSLSAIPLPPVEAPEGYQWELNEAYSDEFDGTKLDTNKWHDHFPGWEGRIPGLFVPETISVVDGCLQVKIGLLYPPRGENSEWWIACGAVQSKAQDASYGYYETRMKASSLRTSSTFWLMNPEGGSKRTELDIQESVGNANRWPVCKYQFRNNTHITWSELSAEGEPISWKKGFNFDLGGNVDEAFHRYGCWWVDARTMHFYLDGEYTGTIEVLTEHDKAPFDQRMYVNLVCEVYDWEVLPDVDRLLDDSLNTTYYDYVRAYKLVKQSAIIESVEGF